MTALVTALRSERNELRSKLENERCARAQRPARVEVTKHAPRAMVAQITEHRPNGQAVLIEHAPKVATKIKTHKAKKKAARN